MALSAVERRVHFMPNRDLFITPIGVPIGPQQSGGGQNKKTAGQ
jgi:hypothetical protein